MALTSCAGHRDLSHPNMAASPPQASLGPGRLAAPESRGQHAGCEEALGQHMTLMMSQRGHRNGRRCGHVWVAHPTDPTCPFPALLPLCLAEHGPEGVPKEHPTIRREGPRGVCGQGIRAQEKRRHRTQRGCDQGRASRHHHGTHACKLRCPRDRGNRPVSAPDSAGCTCRQGIVTTSQHHACVIYSVVNEFGSGEPRRICINHSSQLTAHSLQLV